MSFLFARRTSAIEHVATHMRVMALVWSSALSVVRVLGTYPIPISAVNPKEEKKPPTSQFLLWTQAYLKNVLETSLDESVVPVKSFFGFFILFLLISSQSALPLPPNF